MSGKSEGNWWNSNRFLKMNAFLEEEKLIYCTESEDAEEEDRQSKSIRVTDFQGR